MTLQNKIREKLAKSDVNIVIKQLGYSSKDKIATRINSILDSSTFALEKSGFDFHYSTPDLIRKLCAILTIPTVLCDSIIDETEKSLQAQKQKFKSYLFIETNFKRTGQPVCVLAACEPLRYLSVDSDVQKLPLNEQLEHIQALLRSHYAQQASLPIWGEISHYVYFYDEQTVVVFSPSGEVIDTVTEYFRSQAILSLKH